MKGEILYYGGFALPDKSASANRVVANGKLFESLGYETVFLGSCYDELSGIRQISKNMFEEPHAATTAEWIKQVLCFSNLKNVAVECKNLKMVLLYNVPFITLFLTKMYFSRGNIVVAYDCTEWTQFTEGSVLKKAFKYIDEFFIRKYAHKIADKMIVISKMMEDSYKSDKKVLKLPPLVDVNDAIWHQETEKETDFNFCFAGFPGGNKESLDKVVEAFKSLDNQNTKLKIIGINQVEFSELYPNIVVSDNISFLGKKTHKDTIKNILGCDCYIFIRPSDRRNNAGFPTKFVESFTCGVPIITTDVSDIKEYITLSEDSILLNNYETEDIQKAMKTVLNKGRNKKASVLKADFHYIGYREKAKLWLE